MRYLRPLIALFAIPLTLSATRTHETNPMSSAEEFAEGKRLYRIHCGVCHGMEGKTGRGARLARPSYRRGNSDAELFDLIEGGVPGTDMPGLWMGEEDIWKILLFVRTFAERAQQDACSAEAGAAEAGRRIFHERGSCLACHTVGKQGGRLGPDLTYAGLSYSREQLREALLAPAGSIPDRYRAVRAVTSAGERVEGTRLNETAYHVFVMDRAEEIRSFRKADLRSLEFPEESLMPAYGNLLSPSEVDQLIAYLCTLRGRDKESSP